MLAPTMVSTNERGGHHARGKAERAAVIMSLIESAKLNGLDPWAYLKDVFERLPTLKQRDIAQLLPHNWRAPNDTAKSRTRRSPPPRKHP